MDPRTIEMHAAWMRVHFRRLAIGGIWSYTNQPIIFKKTDDHTFTLIFAPEWYPGVGEQIRRNKIVMAKAGITFKDGR